MLSNEDPGIGETWLETSANKIGGRRHQPVKDRNRVRIMLYRPILSCHMNDFLSMLELVFGLFPLRFKVFI